MHFCAAYERMLPPEATDCVAARRQFNATPGIKARFTGHLHGIDSQMARHIASPPSVERASPVNVELSKRTCTLSVD